MAAPPKIASRSHLGSSAPPRRASWRIDVSDAVPVEGRFEIAVDLILPPELDPAEPAVALVCLPGGFLSRRYFDLEIEGDRRYSFAEAMARNGFITLAFDHLGVGDSSKPEPIEAGYTIGVESIARINQAALDRTLERLAAGDIASDIPSVPDLSTIGVGHSMGSMLTVEQQPIARAHRALVLFSFSSRGTPAFLDDVQRGYANDPVRTRREIGDIAHRTMGSPYPESATGADDDRRAAFGVGTAPPPAEDALHAASTNLLAVGGLLSMIPGGYAPPAAEIDVPVFVLVGDHDLHDLRHTRDELPKSPGVTTLTLDDCWHCHFVANTRETMWQAVTDWLHALGPPPAMEAHNL